MTVEVAALGGAAEATPVEAWNVDGETGRVTVRALPHTDVFVDPGGEDSVTSTSRHNAATLLVRAPAGDFQLSARVKVAFEDTFDAGVLFLRHSEALWGKLCFEYAPDGGAMVVSVINRTVSDDANAFLVDEESIFLRVSRKGDVYAYHASLDGKSWVFVRAFALDGAPRELEIGLEAQSPNGEGCDVTFDEISLRNSTISDFRDGS